MLVNDIFFYLIWNFILFFIAALGFFTETGVSSSGLTIRGIILYGCLREKISGALLFYAPEKGKLFYCSAGSKSSLPWWHRGQT